MINEILFGITMTFSFFIKKDWRGRNITTHVIGSLGLLTFILSQWVFVYQYMKVSLLMPFILSNNEPDDVINKREKRAEFILSCTNITFVVFVILCLVADDICELTSFGDTLAKVRLFEFLPYLVLVGILIYSICRIK